MMSADWAENFGRPFDSWKGKFALLYRTAQSGGSGFLYVAGGRISNVPGAVNLAHTIVCLHGAKCH